MSCIVVLGKVSTFVVFSYPPYIYKLLNALSIHETEPPLPFGLLAGLETVIVPQFPAGFGIVSPFTKVHLFVSMQYSHSSFETSGTLLDVGPIIPPKNQRLP